MKRKLLTFGNRKLSKKQAIWTLPAGRTCIGAGECLKWCYSRKAEKCYPQVKASRLWKLEQSKQKDFIEKMVEALKKSGRQICRIHQDGDYYSQEYLDKWRAIATKLQKIKFYSFTKSFQLDFSNLPDNLIIIQSYGSRFDSKINKLGNTARVIENENELGTGEYLCPYHDKKNFIACGISCNYCYADKPKVKHICFLRH